MIEMSMNLRGLKRSVWFETTIKPPVSDNILIEFKKRSTQNPDKNIKGYKIISVKKRDFIKKKKA